MKIVLLDSYTMNPGDISWNSFDELGEVVKYDRTDSEDVLERLQDADIAIINKVVINHIYLNFKSKTKDTTTFSEAYAKNVRTLDVYMEAETEEVDPQEDPARKSSDVVALQLLKRFRNTRYADRDGRMPPSVLLSKFVSDAAYPMESIIQALKHHAEYMRRQFVNAERSSALIHEVNPTCWEDCFTDRWPLIRSEQQLFISDLNDLLAGLRKIQREDLAIPDMQTILVTLFGESPTKSAIRTVQGHIGTATQSAKIGHKIGGGILLGSAAAARVARASTNMGGKTPW